jgi:hypothetical protein
MSDPADELEDKIDDLRQKMSTREEFIEILRLLLEDFQKNKATWENQTLEHYLAAMIAWSGSMDNYYLHRKMNLDASQPNWKVFADLLLAARVYE